jgi:stalled ribosome rescue protein Dom34
MSMIAIWIDRNHAKIFQFSEEKMERQNLSARHTDHHTHRPDELDYTQRDRKFFGELAQHLGTASQLLILGPGMAKHHFQNYLREHAPLVARNVIGCETVDHPTDPQIAEVARRCFRIAEPVFSR